MLIVLIENMKYRNAIILFCSLLAVCVATTIGCVYYFDKLTLRGALDIATYVAAAVFAIGALARAGASSGGDPIIEQSTRSLSADQNVYDRVSSEDAARGIAFGWVLIGVGFTWGGISYLIYRLAGG